MVTRNEPERHAPATASVGITLVRRFVAICSRLPPSLLALLARFSIAAVFWKSGQTKVQGFAMDVVSGDFSLGWPHLSDSVVELFQYEYQLPFLAPQVAALAAALAEHIFPTLLLVGLATRLSAFALLVMTATIQIFVYPGAYPTHGTWAVVLLYLMSTGPGKLSLDALIHKHFMP